MKRLLPALALLLAAPFVAACSSSGDAAITAPAATVNGVDISSDAVLDVARGGQPAGPELTLPTTQSAAALNELINVELARQAVVDRDLTITPEVEAEALEIAHAVLDPSGAGDLAAGEAAYNELPESVRTHLTDQFGFILTLGRSLPDDETGAAEVTDDQVRQAYDELRDAQYVRRCSSVLLIDPTLDAEGQADKADEVIQRVADGDSFEEIITDESPDPAAPNGGPLGCASRGEMEQQMQQSGIPPEIVTAVFEAEVGEAFGPIATASGSIVGFVEEEQVTEFEEVEAELAAQLDLQNDNLRIQAAFVLIDTSSLEAEVSVDPRFGTWSLVADRSTGQVVDDPADAVGRSVVPPAGAAEPPIDPDVTEAPLIPEGFLDPSGGVPLAP